MRRDRSPLLSWLMLPVGAEVGFSSAGAGALGSAALLSLTPLAAGASGGHGHRLRLCGVADWQRRALVLACDEPGSADAPDRRRRWWCDWGNGTEHTHSAAAVAVCALGVAADSGRAVSVQQLPKVDAAAQRSGSAGEHGTVAAGEAPLEQLFNYCRRGPCRR